MRRHQDFPLAELTTLGLGGPAAELVEAESDEELVTLVTEADAAGRPVLLVAGGSNLVLPDAGWPDLAVAVRTDGVELAAAGERARLSVAAGHDWDALVERCVAEGWSGVECLSGIPGSTGATPIQNVGAYGQEVAETVVAVRALDRESGERVELTPEQCRFAYRSSAFKGSDRYLVLEVSFELERSALSRSIAYAQLAEQLGVEQGARAPLAEVREAVLELRRGKGMVVDPDDPDSRSAGSFFTNPILSAAEHELLAKRVAAELGAETAAPAWPGPDGGIKTSAAWLIERAGFGRAYGDGRAGVSTKHSLALVNRGEATTAELIALARVIRDGVRERFGVSLEAEPTLVGIEL